MARAMKDSGVEWIGEIPEEWEMIRLGAVLESVTDKNKANKEQNALKFTMGAIVPKEIHADDDLTAYTLVQANDIIVNGLNLEFDFITQRVGIVRQGGAITSAYITTRPTKNVAPNFMCYFLKGADSCKALHSMGRGLRKILAYKELRTHFATVPNLSEQQRIADFLDTQTAEIDASIAKTQESIEEYKKLKQAVITQAVTKGIRPGRVMKDSGVEWIGEIPEEWDISTLGRVTREMRNGYVGPTRDLFVEEGERYLQSLHIKDGGIYFEKQPYYVTREWLSSRPTVKAGDILIVQTGDIGQVGLVTEEYAGCGCHALIIATPDEVLISPKFLTYYLMSHTGRELVLAHKTGALLPHLNSGKIKFAFVCVPTDIAEQQEIAAYLDEKCAAIDTLIEKKQAIITELEAYKKSLIYEYVTGKKEVPAAPEAALFK